MKPLVRSNWSQTLLVCGKCSRKVGGGFGRKGKTPLAKALRQELGVGKGRKARIGVAEVKCLGVCPKHAVVALNASDSRHWHLVRPGADVGEVARRVLEPAMPAAPLLILPPDLQLTEA